MLRGVQTTFNTTHRFSIMFDPNWNEIIESPGEIWDIPEMKGWDKEDVIENDDESMDFVLDIQYDY